MFNHNNLICFKNMSVLCEIYAQFIFNYLKFNYYKFYCKYLVF